MAFFTNIESEQLYFSPIFYIKNKHVCCGKLCVVSKSARNIIFLLPPLALTILILTSIKLISMVISDHIENYLDIENINVFVMAFSLLPGSLATVIALICQIPSIKNNKYYKPGDGSLKINFTPSLSIYLIYSFLMINILLGCLWFNKNPKYNGDEIPFFYAISLIMIIISVFLWSRIFWLLNKFSEPSIFWKDSRHF
jgi:hypothetical protein